MWIKTAIVSGALLGAFAYAGVAQEATPEATAPPAATATPAPAATAAPEMKPEQRIAMVKASFVASKTTLRQYEWIETTTLSLNGEEKVRQQNQCYYGAEGSLQRVPVAASAKEEKKRGLRGKAVEAKKEELEASLKDAVALLHQYVPLDPAKIQAAKEAGNLDISVPGADGIVKMTIKNYLKAGDAVEIALDGNKNTVKGLAITSYVGDAAAKEKSPVAAKVTYSAFPDGTIFPAKSGLELSSQKLNIGVENSGYKKQG